jgi:hypothetical protein
VILTIAILLDFTQSWRYRESQSNPQKSNMLVDPALLSRGPMIGVCMPISRSIPTLVNSQPSSLGQPVQYADSIALSCAFDGYVLLSGGVSVRSTTTTIGGDETWQILPISGLGGNVYYGDLVKLALPSHGNVLLSGGSSMRTTTETARQDETWQILSLYSDRTSQAVQFGDLIVLTLPEVDSFLLSGGASVRTTTTVVGQDECWMIVSPVT